MAYTKQTSSVTPIQTYVALLLFSAESTAALQKLRYHHRHNKIPSKNPPPGFLLGSFEAEDLESLITVAQAFAQRNTPTEITLTGLNVFTGSRGSVLFLSSYSSPPLKALHEEWHTFTAQQGLEPWHSIAPTQPWAPRIVLATQIKPENLEAVEERFRRHTLPTTARISGIGIFRREAGQPCKRTAILGFQQANTEESIHKRI